VRRDRRSLVLVAWDVGWLVVRLGRIISGGLCGRLCCVCVCVCVCVLGGSWLDRSSGGQE
jgi:hypothetical protein